MGYLTQSKDKAWGFCRSVLPENGVSGSLKAGPENGLRIANPNLGNQAEFRLMETIQLSITSPAYAAALRKLLVRNGEWNVVNVEVPDLRLDGVVVVDSAALERFPSQIVKPERVVLITRNDPQHLARAWDAGIVSVVSDNDPMSTAMLAIMAARLRVGKAERHENSA